MPEQKKSRLLTQDENDLIFDLLGFKCQAMSTTVIELYTTLNPSNGEWHYKEMGVLCLVKDHNKRSYYFRLYCPNRKMLLWEHEIYNDFQYFTPMPFLHTFEAENCIAGFNFASEDEGKNMQMTLLDTLELKNQKKVERRNRYNTTISKTTSGVKNGGVNLMKINVNSVVQQPVFKSTGKNKRKKFSKADIGVPRDFRHVSHVGWDPNRKEYDLEKADDPQLKDFFNQAGVSEDHLRDKETRKFIYDFISRNGGMEAVKGEMDPPPVPQRVRAAPPRPPTRTLGPPPPPPQRIQPPRTIQSTPKPEIVTAATAYPPPPPPPPPPGPPPPPMMDMGELAHHPSIEIPTNPSVALMEELTKNRKQLKPLNLEKDIDDKKLPPMMATDSHFQLMDQIKEGIKLKHVNLPLNPSPVVPLRGLASALAAALEERSKVIYSDSSSNTGTDEDDEEWD